MNDFYETWWASVIKESKYSIIDLGGEETEALTCMDIHSKGQHPNWNQRMIREGGLLIPAEFAVNFLKTGKYKVELNRYPMESGAALGATLHDEVPETAYTAPRVTGKALDFKTAFVKVGDKEYSTPVDNTLPSATIKLSAEAGNADFTAWFEMADGSLTNAFYVYVTLVE